MIPKSRSRTVLLLVCFTAVELVNAGEPIAPTLEGIGKHTPLIERILKSDKQLTAISIDRIPALPEVKTRLTKPECARAVGGEYRDYVQARVGTTDYFTFSRYTIAAQETTTGQQVIYALSYVKARRVLLFSPFMHPDTVLVKLLVGGAANIDTIPGFERTHGLKLGSMNVRRVQSIAILHEQAHLNDAALDDFPCLVISVLNTRMIAEACYPEAIDEAPPMLKHMGLSPKALFLKLRGAGARGCLICHPSISSKVQQSNPK